MCFNCNSTYNNSTFQPLLNNIGGGLLIGVMVGVWGLVVVWFEYGVVGMRIGLVGNVCFGIGYFLLIIVKVV